MRLHLSEKRNSETIYYMLQRALVPFQNPLWIYKRSDFVVQTSSWLTKRQKSSELIWIVSIFAEVFLREKE